MMVECIEIQMLYIGPRRSSMGLVQTGVEYDECDIEKLFGEEYVKRWFVIACASIVRVLCKYSMASMASMTSATSCRTIRVRNIMMSM
jgi:hypothetical protein